MKLSCCPRCALSPILDRTISAVPYRGLDPSFNYECNGCGFVTYRFNHTKEEAQQDWENTVNEYVRSRINEVKTMQTSNENWAERLERNLVNLRIEVKELKEKLAKVEGNPDWVKQCSHPWVGKWGYVSDDNPDCPNRTYLTKLTAYVKKYNDIYPFRAGNMNFKYFMPATYEELNGKKYSE